MPLGSKFPVERLFLKFFELRHCENKMFYFNNLVFCKHEFVFSVSPCDSVTCQNEGTCVVEAGLAICYCRGDYSGATCAGEYYIRLKNL